MTAEDTIIAPATTPGTGAISVIRVSGARALKIADKAIRFRHGTASSSEGYRLKFGTVLQPDGSVLDEVLVSVFHAPNSYTGEDGVEISCHASAYIVSQIIARFCDEGARPAGPGEFTRRAFMNGKMDLAQAEAVADVIASQSASALRVAMNQLRGGFSSELGEMRDKMLEITSLMELELDFSEEDVEFADRTRLSSLVDTVIARVTSLADSFRTGNAIRNGVPVAIVGEPNVGKSSLLNALLGDDRAIVSSVAGTTRDTIEETMTVGGILFRFIDTAGIRESSDEVEKIGVSRALKKLSEADVVLGVLDATSSPAGIAAAAAAIVSHVDFTAQTLVLLLNKCDAEGNCCGARLSASDLGLPKGATVPFLEVSARRGDGLEALRSLLAEGQQARIGTNAEAVMVTNARHYEALRHTADALKRVRTGLDSGTPTDLVAQDLREALWHLGTITGAISTDEVLGNIFEHFCIGK